jgi:hypothetical protein
MELDDIQIKSDLGNFYLPTKKIVDLYQYLGDERKKNSNIRKSDLQDFFDDDYQTEYFNLMPIRVPIYMKCFWDVVERDYEIIKMTNYDGKHLYETSPVSYEFDVALGQKESLCIDCMVFLKSKLNNSKIAVYIMPYNDGDSYYLEMEIYFTKHGTNFKQFWNEVEEYFKTLGPLKNAIFNTKWEFVEYNEIGWEGIVLSPDKKHTIERNVINFIKNIEDYKQMRLPTSRGILISGPPGTGKTLLCETIMNEAKSTVIYVTSDSVEKTGDIKEIYKTARLLAPSIVIVEDIDTLGALDRREGGNHPLLGEFLNCLNGVGTNEGVITIATTNYPKHLDVALVDRPGRIDLRIELGLPEPELREHIFKKYLKEMKTEKLNYKPIVKKSEGLSGAYIREVVMSAYLDAKEKDEKITQKRLEESLDLVLKMKMGVDSSISKQDHYHL